MNKIYITGVSGTGKTTIAKLLNDKGVKAYSIDEVDNLCHWVNKNTGKVVDYEAKLDSEFINSHEWICDIRLLKEITEQKDFVVVLGLAENQADFVSLFDKVILLHCKPETFIKRVSQRKDNAFGQEKTAQEYLLNTYQKFESDTLKNGAIPISVEEPIDTVVKMIISEIKKPV